MTGAEANGSGGKATDGPAPVISKFRRDIEIRVKTLRSLRNPTVEQIERAQFWEEYLRTPEPLPRALQDPPSEPTQTR